MTESGVLISDREVLQTRLDALHSGTSYAIAVNFVAAIVGTLLSNRASTLYFICWLAYMLVLLSIRFVLHRAYSNSGFTLGENAHWQKLVSGTAICLGIGWCWFEIALLPLFQSNYQLFLLLLALVLVTAPVIAPFRFAAGSFLVLAGLPLIIYLLRTGDLVTTVLLTVLLGVQWVTLEFLLREITKNTRLRRQQDWARLERTEQMRAVETANRLLAQALTDREAAEAELKIAKEIAEKASQAKGNFLAYTSHEIRTPLNAIVGFTRTLLDTPLTRDQRDQLQRVRGAGTRLLSLINDLLDMSKIEASKLEIDKIDFNLREIVQEVVQEQIVLASEKASHIAVSIDANVPETLIGDPMRLGQVLRNLVSNAVKFTENGTIQTIVSMSSKQQDLVLLRFSVRDSGIGIPLEKQKLLFQPYQQTAAGTSRAFGGTGLGLAISKSLCELMSGSIELHSELGKGTEITFELPFQVGQLRQENLSAKTERHVADIHGMRVLVAEDNDDNQVLIELLLNRAGANVTVVGNGQLALEKLRTEEFDLVLMDLEMPVMDGFQAVSAIRSIEQGKGSHVPIIALSAHALVGYREKCLLAGMDDYLTKPVDEDALHETLKRFSKATNDSVVAAESRK